MFDREKIFDAFHQALREEKESGKKVRPRTVAVRAHAIYCARLPELAKRPAFDTFRRFTTGRLALPEVVSMLQSANVRPRERARLDRRRLRAAFQEAVRLLDVRIRRGGVSALHIARRAHGIYIEGDDGTILPPSLSSFKRLLYGKLADPEILSLVEEVLRKTG